MILAIGLEGENVSSNFGACNDFRLFEIEDGTVGLSEDIYNDTQTHKLRPQYLKDLGVDVLIIGALGATAFDLLNARNIKCLDGTGLTVEEALDQYLKGTFTKEHQGLGPHCS